MHRNEYLFNKASLDTVLRESVCGKGLPFSIGGICTKEGTVYEGFEYKNDICSPVNMDSIIWLASMTKAITTVALMQLVERGEISLKQAAGSILPELSEQIILKDFDELGRAILTPCKNKITIEQLLNHTSGFGYSFWNSVIDRYHKEKDLPDTTSGSLRCLSAPLVREPGTGWEYGISTDWAGLILEKITGLKLETYLKTNIFNPLNMNDTGFKVKDFHRLTPFYELDSQGTFRKIPFVFPQNPEFHSGGAGLYGTVRDYLRFMRMLLNKGALDGTKILLPSTVERMFRNSIGKLTVVPLKGCGNSLELKFDDGVSKKWGLCYMINEEQLPSGRSPGSQFWGGAANTFVWIDPSKEMAGIFATQALPFLNKPCFCAFTEFETAAYKVAVTTPYDYNF